MIRGLHYHERGQDDLFVCLQGRPASSCSTARRRDLHRGHRRREPGRDLHPRPHAHGFEALTDLLFCYHVTEEYDPADPDEQGIPWNDPRVAAPVEHASRRSCRRGTCRRVLITGAGGQLGRALAQAFAGDDVLALDARRLGRHAAGAAPRSSEPGPRPARGRVDGRRRRRGRPAGRRGGQRRRDGARRGARRAARRLLDRLRVRRHASASRTSSRTARTRCRPTDGRSSTARQPRANGRGSSAPRGSSGRRATTSSARCSGSARSGTRSRSSTTSAAARPTSAISPLRRASSSTLPHGRLARRRRRRLHLGGVRRGDLRGGRARTAASGASRPRSSARPRAAARVLRPAQREGRAGAAALARRVSARACSRSTASLPPPCASSSPAEPGSSARTSCTLARPHDDSRRPRQARRTPATARTSRVEPHELRRGRHRRPRPRRAARSEGCDAVVNFAAETHKSTARSSTRASSSTRTCSARRRCSNGPAPPASRASSRSRPTRSTATSTRPASASREDVAVRPSQPVQRGQGGGDLQVRAYSAPTASTVTITRGANNYGPNQYPEKLVPLFDDERARRRAAPVYGDAEQVASGSTPTTTARRSSSSCTRARRARCTTSARGVEATIEEIADSDPRADRQADPSLIRRRRGPRRPRPPLLARPTQAARELGWEPRRSFDDGARRDGRTGTATTASWWEPIKVRAPVEEPPGSSGTAQGGRSAENSTGEVGRA